MPPSSQFHEKARQGDPTKLVCRKLWKIFAPGTDRSALKPNRATQQELEALCSVPGSIAAVKHVSFEVAQGRIFVIMGLSGSGKSTVLRCISRLVEPTAGEIVIDNVDVLLLSPSDLLDLRRKKVGMVFQHFGLLPHLSVLDNVAYPLRVQGVERKARHKRAQEMIELVGLKGRELSFPRELSGGQQQRVGIARSLAVEPDLWLLDEPFSALDPLIRRQMQDEFLRLQRLMQKTIVFVTHDFLEAMRIADQIAIMRDGKIVQIGSPADLVLRPADSYVADFTRDAPRDKVLTAADIARPAATNHSRGNTVSDSASLQEVITRMASRQGPMAVLDSTGRVVGEITETALLQALAGIPADESC
jgi:glycine betaine/proline transport system ATP-binding protein